MFNLKLEQAKHAIKHDRLDEAGKLLVDPAVAGHRDALALSSKLAEKLVGRGHEHLNVGRHEAAVLDARAAYRFGGNQPAVQALMRKACEAQAEHRAAGAEQQAVLQAAKRRLEAGMLSVCGMHLDGLDDQDAKRIKEDLAFRRESAEQAIAVGRRALAAGAWGQAASALRTVQASAVSSEAAVSLAASLAESALKHAQGCLAEGELEQAAAVLSAVQPVMADPMPATRLLKAVNQIGQAAAWLRQGKPQQALPVLQRVAGRLPQAAWLKQLVKDTQQAATAYASIDAGPLGELGTVGIGTLSSVGVAKRAQSGAQSGAQPHAGVADEQTHESPRSPKSLKSPRSSKSPDPFDGIDQQSAALDNATRNGEHARRVYILETQNAPTSWLALGTELSMGPISGKQPVDLGLVADPLLPVVRFVCEEGDWFLQADRAVEVNGRPTNNALLQPGDKIALSPRCRLKFTKPHAASATSVLELMQGRLSRPDIRRIVLVADALVIGNTQAAHVVSADAVQPVVLSLKPDRGDRVLTLASGAAGAAGATGVPGVPGSIAVATGEALPIAKAFKVGGVGLRLTAAS